MEVLVGMAVKKGEDYCVHAEYRNALVKEVAQMLPGETLGAPPREAMCGERR
jgi:hypothetical protein